MSIWLRRIIYLAFIVLFVLLAPLLALYSIGYRYHWTKHRLERTGLIVVNGRPDDAVVRIDGVIRSHRLPAHIGGLSPNEYAIRIERDGFHAWEQRRVVSGGETTVVSNMLLFRDDQPERIADGTVRPLSVSADRRWATFTSTRSAFAELWILDLESHVATLVLRSAAPASGSPAFRVTWSPERALLLTVTARDVLVVDPRRPQSPQSLAHLFPIMPTAIEWELGSTESLIVRRDAALSRIDLRTERATTLGVFAPSTPYGVHRSTLYTMNDSALQAVDTSSGDVRIIAVFKDATLQRIVSARGTILTMDLDHPLRRVAVTTTDGTYTERPGFGFREAPDQNDAFLWQTTTNDLWATWGTPSQSDLLIRRDQPIIAAAWHADAPYIFACTEQDCVVVELIANTSRRTTALVRMDRISSMTLSPDGTAIYLTGERGGQPGLYRLMLR